MLPALIHPVLASLAAIAFASIFPIAVTVIILGTSGHFGDIFVSGKILAVWLTSYAATGEFFSVEFR